MGQREVLIVDDDRQVRDVPAPDLPRRRYKCLLANDGQEGVEVFPRRDPRGALPADRHGPQDADHGRHRSAQQVRQADPDAAVIVLTGAADVKTAISSLKLGAYDFIMKPVNVDELLIAADRALERRQLLLEHRPTRSSRAARRRGHAGAGAAQPRLQDAYRTTLEALGSALDTRDVGTESHSRARPRLCAGDRARLRRAGAGSSGPGSRVAAARHRQDRDPRRDLAEAGPADRRRVEDHAASPGDRQAADRKIPFLQAPCRSSIRTTRSGMGAAYPLGPQGRGDSAGKPGSSWWSTPSTRSPSIARTRRPSPSRSPRPRSSAARATLRPEPSSRRSCNVPETLLEEIRRKSVEP